MRKGSAVLSSCLMPASGNEHYALAYSDDLARDHREEEGGVWLEARVRKFGSSSRAATTWITWIKFLGKWGIRTALSACYEALAQHGSLPELRGRPQESKHAAHFKGQETISPTADERILQGARCSC